MELLRRLLLTLGVLCMGLLLATAAHAECGGNAQCIAVGVTPTDALNAHHGGGAPDTPTLAFGNQVIGTGSAALTLNVAAVTGPAGVMATLGTITLSGSSAAEFSITGGTCSTSNGPVQGGAQCTITVAFNPTSPGAKTATLNVPLNPVCGGCITGRTANLTGTGTGSLPGAGATTVSTQTDTPVSVNLAPLVSGTAITGIRIVTAPGNGTASVSGMRVTYTPSRGFLGSDSFTYQSFSATAASAAATVSISVAARADPARDPKAASLVNAQTQTARRFARAQMLNLQQRMDSLHSVAAAPAAGGPARPQQADAGAAGLRPTATMLASLSPEFTPASVLGRLFDVARTGTLKLAQSSDPGGGGPLALPHGVSVWVGGSMRFGSRDLSGDSAGLRFDSEGISAGIDRRVSDRLVLGLGLGYGRGTTDIDTDGSKNSSSGRSVMGYASFQPAPSAFIDASLGYGTIALDSARFVPAANEFARAHRSGSQWFGSLAAGYEFRGQGRMLVPYGRLDYSRDRLGQASESGGGLAALTYFEQKLESLQLALGLRAETQHRASFGWVAPRVRLEFRHEFKGDGGAIVGYADQVGGPSYVTNPAGDTRSTLVAGIGSDFLFGAGLKLGIDYQMERSSGVERSHGLRVLLTKALDDRSPSLNMTEARPMGDPVNVEAAFTSTDNVTRARDGADRRSDQAYSLNVDRRAVFALGTQTRVVANAFVNTEKSRNFEGLDRISGGLQGEWQYRASGAFSTPTWGVFVRGTLDDYHADARSGLRQSIGLSYRQLLTDRVSMYGAVSRNVRSTRNSVFDTRDYAVRVNLDYDLGRRNSLYAGAEYRRGDALSSGSPSAQSVVIARQSAPDDAFGGQMIAYRFDAESLLWTLGYNRPLGPRDSIDISWRHVSVTPMLRGTFPAPGGIYGVPGTLVTVGSSRYTANMLSLAWLTRF